MKTDNWVALPRTTFIQPFEHREFKLVWAWNPHLYVLSPFGMRNYSSEHKKGNSDTSHLHSVVPARCGEPMVAQNLWKWPTGTWFNLRLMPWEICTKLRGWPNTGHGIAQRPRAEPNMTQRKNKNK